METNQNNEISIPGIDTSAGIKYCGSTEMYIDMLKDIYGVIDKRCEETEAFLKEKDLKNYTTCVHSLKTTCRMMGHTSLSERFYELEMIGKEGALEKAQSLTADVLNSFRSLKPLLEPYVSIEKKETIPFSSKEIASLLLEVASSATDFDVNRAEDAISKLLTYECDKELSDQLLKLSNLVNDLDYTEAADLASSLAKSL